MSGEKGLQCFCHFCQVTVLPEHIVADLPPIILYTLTLKFRSVAWPRWLKAPLRRPYDHDRVM